LINLLYVLPFAFEKQKTNKLLRIQHIYRFIHFGLSTVTDVYTSLFDAKVVEERATVAMTSLGSRFQDRAD